MNNPWDNKGTDKDRISKLEAELEELKSQKDNVQKVEVVHKEKKGIGWVTWLVIIIAGIFLLSEFRSSVPVSKLGNQTQDVKNCVDMIGDGVYKNKSLEWKLETCNAK